MSRSPLRQLLLPAPLLLALLMFGCISPPPPAGQPRPADGAVHGMVMQPPLELPSFTLLRTDGTAFQSADMQGRLSLVFFGYTTCPDVCPMTRSHVSRLFEALGADAAGVDAYLVTVDPERDTPERLADYTSKFDRRITGLTGTPAELERARSVFGIVAQRREVPESAVGYVMDHSAGLYLVQPDPRVRLFYPYGTPREDIQDDLKRLIAEQAGEG
ncbi:MAG: SCO family protein [Chloroflexi bacterium]|nr:SCO family protein [Chloroflexota bacterium]